MRRHWSTCCRTELMMAVWVVLLFFGREAFSFIEDERCLRLPLPRFWNRSDEFGKPSTANDPLGWLTLVVKLPMTAWEVVRRIKNRVCEELLSLGHRCAPAPRYFGA